MAQTSNSKQDILGLTRVQLYWTLAAVAVYLLVNILHQGSAQVLITLNSFILLPQVLVTSVLAVQVWRWIKESPQNRSLWLSMMAGLGMWMVAEIWWVVASLIQEDIPYPSGADFFWLLGYLPFFVALILRVRKLPPLVETRHKVMLWVAIILVYLFTVVFILAPILQASTPSSIVADVLNILYPVMEGTSLALALRVLFEPPKGRYGAAWVFLALGFVFHAVSNLVFSIVDANGWYYVNNQNNILSSVGVDGALTLSYASWILGIFVLLQMFKELNPVRTKELALPVVPNTHVLVFTDAQGQVIEVSKNYGDVFGPRETSGKELREVLGISAEKANEILTEAQTQPVLKERPIYSIAGLSGRNGWLSGVSMMTTAGASSGANLLMRFWNSEGSLDGALTDYENSVVRFLVGSAETKREANEVPQLLRSYYLPFLRELYNRVLFAEGAVSADALYAELEALTDEHPEWGVTMEPRSLVFFSPEAPAHFAASLPEMVALARKFAEQTLGVDVTNGVLRSVSNHWDESVHRGVGMYAPPVLPQSAP